MRKLLCITGALLVGSSFTFAELPKVEYHGLFYLYNFMWDNADFNADTKDGDQHFYLHSDFTVDADFGVVSSRAKFGAWGTFGKHPITGEEGWHGTPGQNIGLREAYLTISNLFGTPISFRIGKQHVCYGEQVFDGGEDGIMGLKLFTTTDMFDVDLFAYRLVEGGGTAFIGSGRLDILDDCDLFGVWPTAKLLGGKIKFSPYGFHRTRNFPKEIDTIINTDTIWITPKDNPIWFGTRCDISPLPLPEEAGKLDIAAEFTMMAGSKENKEKVDYAGMHYMGRLSYTLPGIPLTFGGAYVFLSGDDPATAKNELYESPTWGPYTFGFYKGWSGFGPAHLQRTTFGFSLTAPREPMVTNLSVINGNIGYAIGPISIRADFFMYTKNKVAEGKESAMGNEIALLVKYTYKVITFGFTGGYWMPGKYFEGEDPMMGGYLFTAISF